MAERSTYPSVPVWGASVLLLMSAGCSQSTPIPLGPWSEIVQLNGDHQAPAPPEAIPADEASVPDDAAVIGVSTGNCWRAYLVDALSEPSDSPANLATTERQVVNDLLGDVPITVVYCTRNKVCRVLTSRDSTLLNVTVAGRSEVELEIWVNGQRFGQNDPRLPLEDYPFQTTTWSKWKTQHPRTEIYIGNLAEG